MTHHHRLVRLAYIKAHRKQSELGAYGEKGTLYEKEALRKGKIMQFTKMWVGVEGIVM